jgi:Uma2 family endonuclease
MATATREPVSTKRTPPDKGRGRMTVVTDDGTITAPSAIGDIDAFREWLNSDPALESVRTWFIDGEVWIDMSKEQVYTHVRIKTRLISKLDTLVEEGELGLFLADGVLVTNREADLSGNPDAVFASNETLASGRLTDVPGKVRGVVELQGTPDMVLEVVSDSSERKDNQTLFEKYWEAGIPEYWLVDARGDDIEFSIYKHGPKGYAATRKQAGWLKSGVFGKSFKLTRGTDKVGKQKFTLEVK